MSVQNKTCTIASIFAPYIKSGDIYKIFDSHTREKIIAELKQAKENGADMNNDNEESWLNQVRDPEIIRALVELGTDPNHLRKIYSNLAPRNEVVYWTTPLLNEIKARDAEKVKLLLELGADPNFSSPPIFKVQIYFDSLSEQKESANKIITLLAEYGADLDVKDQGYTFMNTETPPFSYIPVKTLIELGASVEPAPDGDTPLHKYVKRYPSEYMEKDIDALLEAGVNIEARNNIGETAFVTACSFYTRHKYKLRFQYYPLEENYKNLLKALVIRGADINASARSGYLAIEMLPKRFRKELIKLASDLASYHNTLHNIQNTDLDLYER